jgi:hypothetical protein
MPARLLSVVLASFDWFAFGREPICGHWGEKEAACKINGEGCEESPVTFEPLNLTVMKWNSTTKTYNPKPVGQLEAHVAVGGADDWQMYLHGPMLRPWREMGKDDSMPPFYVQATFTNKVYRFEQLKKEGGIGNRGKPMAGIKKVVAHALAPSTSFPIENSNGTLQGFLVAEGQPFLINAPLDPKHTELDFGGVDYVTDKPSGDKSLVCEKIFPNAIDKSSHYKTGGDVTNTVSCHPHTGVCFFSVWKFYDDQKPIWNKMTKKLMPDCLHYCVVDSLDQVGGGCKKGGVVTDENGEPICSKAGVGAVHGMTVAFGENLIHKDPNEFDIFLVFTGGAQFVGGESSLKKVTCKKKRQWRPAVLKSEVFGRDLFEASVNRTSPTGMAPMDVGGDHAWVDESGKYVWVSTFRMGNAGIHMLDYQTGELIYSVHGTATYLKNNYAYSAGIHGAGHLGYPKSTILVGTSACTHPKTACAPVPWDPLTKAMGMEAKGLMYVIDISELLPPAEENQKHAVDAAIVV